MELTRERIDDTTGRRAALSSGRPFVLGAVDYSARCRIFFLSRSKVYDPIIDDLVELQFATPEREARTFSFDQPTQLPSIVLIRGSVLKGGALPWIIEEPKRPRREAGGAEIWVR